MTWTKAARNLLFAALAGVAATTVSAQVPLRFCAGPQDYACLEDEFCEFTYGTCGAAGRRGLCKWKPDVCTREYLPVCGCDGKTYGNDCERRAAGVPKVNDGAC